MHNTFSTLFYPKKGNIDRFAKVPIYLRITINGKRAEINIKRKINLSDWNSSTGKVKGKSATSQEFNRYLNSVNEQIHLLFEGLQKEVQNVTPELIKNHYTGKKKNDKMLLQVFEKHNNQVENLVGRDFAAGTLERYKTAKKHLQDYICLEYNLQDIPLSHVNHEFITQLEYYLKTERNCSHNTTIKYITNFKKIIRIALANNWIIVDPFANWKSKLKVVDREFLTQDEIQEMIQKEFNTTRLDQVKDIFLFSCFTGLAYVDVKKLCWNHIVTGVDGDQWIKMNRTKTKTRSSIPLLPSALSIIDKYNPEKGIDTSNKLLPVLSNQKMNAYLKEISDLCKINKNLTFHLARHTFATTVTLSNGVSIESVSKMLGHKNLKTTQHYAKILDRKVSDDMKILKQKFSLEFMDPKDPSKNKNPSSK